MVREFTVMHLIQCKWDLHTWGKGHLRGDVTILNVSIPNHRI